MMVVNFQFDTGDRVEVPPKMLSNDGRVREGVIESAQINSLGIIAYGVSIIGENGLIDELEPECWRQDKLKPWVHHPIDERGMQMTFDEWWAAQSLEGSTKEIAKVAWGAARIPAHTPGPWWPGKSGGCVVSDNPINGEMSGADDPSGVEYYGGHLVAESISKKNIPVIAAAPFLLQGCLFAMQMLEELNQLGNRECQFRIQHIRIAINQATCWEGRHE